MIDENSGLEFGNEERTNDSDNGNPSFRGVGTFIGREIRREVSHEVVGGIFGFIQKLFTDDE